MGHPGPEAIVNVFTSADKRPGRARLAARDGFFHLNAAATLGAGQRRGAVTDHESVRQDHRDCRRRLPADDPEKQPYGFLSD